MILDFLRKPIQLKYFLIFILLSPMIIVILSVIVSVLEPSDIASLKEKPYECGSFGDQKMHIDRRYFFLQDLNIKMSVTGRKAIESCIIPKIVMIKSVTPHFL